MPMKLPFKVEEAAAKSLGFAPGALALPTPHGLVFVVGLALDYSKVFVTPECYRLVGKRLVPAHVKTYNEVGPINAIDIRLPSLRVYIDKLCAIHEDMPREGVMRIIGRQMDDLRDLCTKIIGRDFTNGQMVPGELRVVNKALEYLSQGKRDHARLFLQWPAFCQFFLDTDIIDRSVAGESMWDLLPHSFDEAAVKELRRMKKFSTTWVDSGVPTDVYLGVLTKACAFLPDGAQRPETSSEAKSLIHMSTLCDQAFRSLEPTMQVKVKRALYSHTDTWKSQEGAFSAEYAYDWIHYVYYNLLLDGFRVNGIHNPTEEQRVRAFFGIVGGNLQRIAAGSKEWHSRLPGMRGRHDASIPDSWAPAIGTLHVPAFRTVEGGEDITNVYIVPLDSDEDLAKEGTQQHHCVYTQKRLCYEGELRIVSIRQKIEQDYKTLSTASFYIAGNGRIQIRDHRGFANANPSYTSREALGWFEGEINGTLEGFTSSFPFNREWNPKGEIRKTDGREARAALLDRFEQCRPAMAKKMQKGGFEAFLLECV